MSTAPPNIVRAAYAELIVTDLDRAKWFWVDMLGFALTTRDDEALYLRGCEETTHHCLVLRKGTEPAAACLAFRVWAESDLDAAEQWYGERGCRVQRRPAGATRGIGESVRVEDPLGFTLEFFQATDRTERLLQRFELHHGAAIARIDHFNISVNDAPRPTTTTSRSAFGARRRSKTRTASMRRGCTASRACTTLP